MGYWDTGIAAEWASEIVGVAAGVAMAVCWYCTEDG